LLLRLEPLASFYGCRELCPTISDGIIEPSEFLTSLQRLVAFGKLLQLLLNVSHGLLMLSNGLSKSLVA
jgi:hypothetical protein